MDIIARRKAITDILEERKYMEVEELSQILGVSAVTIRTDLTSLEQNGAVVRTHGGAMISEKKSAARLLSSTMTEFENEKNVIAEEASVFISDGSTIIIDSGSTTIRLLDHIGTANVTVVTNSIPVVNRLKDNPSADVIVIGGSLRRSTEGTIGPLANLCMASVNVDTYFMGSANFDTEGITCTNLMEAELKKTMMKAADKVVFLADSSKFGRKAFASLCSWDEIDAFVTDSIDRKFKTLLEEKGLEVLCCEIRD